MSDDAIQRFRDFVTLRLDTDKVLYEEEERSLICDGIAKFKLAGDQARGIVAVVADVTCQILEREVSRSMLVLIQVLSGKRGAINKRHFEQGIAMLNGLTKGQLSDAEARAWLKRLVEKTGLKIRGRGLLRRKRWFKKIKTAV